ncbi:MAG TPA: hypothetical protein VGM47_03165 [Gammaproteobacteria bacterium]
MNRILRYALLPLMLMALAPTALADTEAAPVAALRAFFRDVASSDAKAAWNLFTGHTQDSVVKSVADSEKLDPVKVRALFDSADHSIKDGFWASFDNSVQAGTFVTLQMESTGPDKDAPGSVTITMPNGGQVKMLMYLERRRLESRLVRDLLPRR